MDFIRRLIRPKNKIDFSEVSASLERLGYLTDQLDEAERAIEKKESRLFGIVDGLDNAVWAKDVDNKFVYANTKCRHIFLHHEGDIAGMSDADFVNNRFASVCAASDDVTKTKLKTCRFIEHCINNSSDVWMDVTKSPYFKDGVLIGTVGSGSDITQNIPNEIRKKFTDPASVEVSVDWDFDLSALLKPYLRKV